MRRYGKYEPLAFPWLTEIPSHWDVKKFRHLFSFSRGLSITKADLKDKGTPCVNYGEIHSKYGFEVDPDKHPLKCVNEEFIESSPDSLLSKGDFVFADTSEDIEGSGNFTYLNSDIPTFAGYHTIIAKPAQNFSYRYMAYHFESIAYRTQIRRAVNGTKVYSITQSILKSTDIILPPLEEQTAIANYLDEKTAQIDTLIEKKQKLIELLKEERKAIINEAVSGEGKNWERKKLKHVLRVNSGEAIASSNIDSEGTYPVYGGNGIMGYTEEYNSDNSDIIIGRVGAKCGNVRLVKGKKWISDNALIATVYNDYSREYVALLLEAMNLNSMANQNAQPLITGTMVKDKVAYFPEPLMQIKIVERVKVETKRIDATIEKIETEIGLMHEYKIALISEVVTGKVKVV